VRTARAIYGGVKSKSTFITITLLLTGCVTTDETDFCQIPSEQKYQTIESVDAFISTITDESVTYEMSPYLLNEGKLSKSKKGCWTYLLPKSLKPGGSVLDGDGGVYVNPITLEVGPVFWFKY
jgi:hypothetical protein